MGINTLFTVSCAKLGVEKITDSSNEDLLGASKKSLQAVSTLTKNMRIMYFVFIVKSDSG